jgi:hypothetical protein
VVGIGCSGVGAAASIFGWFYVGWGSLLAIGTGLVGIELWRRGLAPKLSVLAMGGGLATGAVTWGVLRIARVGRPDEWGEYGIANAAGFAVASVALAVGLIGIGRWLRSERPVDLGVPGGPLPSRRAGSVPIAPGT